MLVSSSVICEFSGTSFDGSVLMLFTVCSLNSPLPFPDSSFDLVRMSCLTMCISYEKWQSILKEINRILMVGGRLEMIDDHIFFAYGSLPAPSQALAGSDPLISSGQSHVGSIGTFGNRRGQTGGADDQSETGTLSGHSLRRAYTFPARPSNGRSGRQSSMSNESSSVSMIHSIDHVETDDPWHEQVSSSREIEALFENMLNVKFGIHLCPSQFVLEMMEGMFGFAREIETMHLTLAPPEVDVGRHEPMNQLKNAPGLVLWPSTLIPLPQAEVETHALRHNKTLLACRSQLVDYAVELSFSEEGGAGDEVAQQRDGVMEALYGYEE